jgi:glycosyltransferase involved in cell wall biosynthesis
MRDGAEAIVPAHVPVDTLPASDARPPGIPAELERWAPDVVYVHSLESAELEAALLARFPCVLFAHNYYGTCATGTKRFAFPHLRVCTRALGPACFAFNYARRCGGLSPITLACLYALQARRRKHLPLFGAVLVASEHMRREMLRHGIVASRVLRVPMPSPDIAPLLAVPERRSFSDRVLFVGRLTRLKGVDFLLRALPAAGQALGRTLALTIAGTGPEQPALADLARAIGVRTEFVGQVDRASVALLMRDADALAVPSLWPEPFGLVGIEAAGFGTPSVGFALGAIPEWLRPGITGELAPGDPPTPEGLAAALVRALSDAGHHQRLREGAWAWARGVTMDDHVHAVETVFNDLLRRT